MDIKLLKPKMRVLIDLKCKFTRDIYGVNDEMEKMVGTSQIIQKVDHLNRNKVIINNFNWSAEDLTVLKSSIKIKKQPIVHFDVKELVV